MKLRLASAIALLVVLLAGFLAERAWQGIGPRVGTDTLLVVPAGSSSAAIARQLEAAGVLAWPRVFLWGVRLAGAGEDLRAGRYRFRRPSSPALLLHQLREGDTEKVWLTLPEGLWLDETVGLISRQLGLDSLDLAERVRRPRDWSHPFLEGAANLEGYLLPDTYAFEHPADPVTVIGSLLDAFDANLAALRARAPADWPWSPREWTILASIVEAEAQRDAERPRIAAVYLNRLAKGMKLEADPTVVYGLGVRKQRLYYKHLKSDSPYNTYRQAGLPPGPICSPGRASMASLLAADPAEPYLYFVADGAGGHRFAVTFAEHQRNVAALRKQQGRR